MATMKHISERLRESKTNILTEKLDILIVIDMQNDFITGSLGSQDAVEVVGNVKKKIDSYRKNGYPVIFTKDTHANHYLETHEGKLLPIEHCIISTPGWKIYDGLKNEDDVCIWKMSFGYTNWEDVILQVLNKHNAQLSGINKIEIVGLCTDICVVSNALILRSTFTNVDICVDASCCAGTSKEKHKAALEVMKSCQIEIVNDEEKEKINNG